MNAARWLASPLTGTAVVFAGLFLLAFPLRQLTSARPLTEAPPSAARISTTDTAAVLRVKLLAPARRLVLRDAAGAVLLDVPSPAAGETEHDVALRLTDEELELALSADFDGPIGETAVFLTVMPDGREEQTRYATGGGLLEETLRYEWRHTH